MFEINREYNRQRDIRDQFGGQRQGGISTPANHPAIFIFISHTGLQHGYIDGYDEDGVFRYTGEGHPRAPAYALQSTFSSSSKAVYSRAFMAHPCTQMLARIPFERC